MRLCEDSAMILKVSYFALAERRGTPQLCLKGSLRMIYDALYYGMHGTQR